MREKSLLFHKIMDNTCCNTLCHVPLSCGNFYLDEIKRDLKETLGGTSGTDMNLTNKQGGQCIQGYVLARQMFDLF